MVANNILEPDTAALPAPAGSGSANTESVRLSKAREKSLAFATLPPEPGKRAGVWAKPVSHDGARGPMWWLLGAHGGAGVSTLAHQLAPAGDCQREWPAVLGDESPFVVLVARETIPGLERAHDLLRQYHCGQAGPGRVILLGLITVAAQPGSMPAPVRRHRRVIADLVPEDGLWRVEWSRDAVLSPLGELPIWTPGDLAPAKGRDRLAPVRELGEHLFATITALVGGPGPKTEGAQSC
ncbi:hypothetical protein [Nocardia yamanashiensis]|uniref:hypothetical protein n=1 Tax=Nocardia yamanashiensis TaxID=209247 RepID=UPI000ABF6EB9|nr:hypothetical protein [Nocardia yamanashiensis]